MNALHTQNPVSINVCYRTGARHTRTRAFFKEMNSAQTQTPFASNTDETATGDDASSCKLTVNRDESEQIKLQKVAAGYAKHFLLYSLNISD